jgi:hypothetical protein
VWRSSIPGPGQPMRAGICHLSRLPKSQRKLFLGICDLAAKRIRIHWRRRHVPRPQLLQRMWCTGFLLTDDEAKVMLGSLDQAPGDIAPRYELWIGRREHWMQPLPWVRQFEHDRESDAESPVVDDPLPEVAQQPKT